MIKFVSINSKLYLNYCIIENYENCVFQLCNYDAIIP